jgi:hypothetical protein
MLTICNFTKPHSNIVNKLNDALQHDHSLLQTRKLIKHIPISLCE